jgi:threonine synthase
VRAFGQGAPEAEPWPDTRTQAFGLTVPAPLGGFLALEAVRATGGMAVEVTDAVLASVHQVARAEGTWICPEGAACFAAAEKLRNGG